MQQAQPQSISDLSGWVMVPESFDGKKVLGWVGVGNSGSYSVHSSFGSRYLCCFPTPSKPGVTLLGIRARLHAFLMSICCFLFLWDFQFLFFHEGQAFHGKKGHPLSLPCSAVNLSCLLINFGQVWPSCGILSHSAFCQQGNGLSWSSSS